MEKFKVSVKLHCTAREVFTGWLNDKLHSEFTGGKTASTSPSEGGHFSVLNGCVTGINVEIFPYRKIIQKWRSADFTSDESDSLAELFFTFKDDHTLITVTHSNIPEGKGDICKKIWKEDYFTHMKKYYDK